MVDVALRTAAMGEVPKRMVVCPMKFAKRPNSNNTLGRKDNMVSICMPPPLPPTSLSGWEVSGLGYVQFKLGVAWSLYRKMGSIWGHFGRSESNFRSIPLSDSILNPLGLLLAFFLDPNLATCWRPWCIMGRSWAI